ncbi:MAG: HU-CCDC81 and SPOR domain-containing protein [Flavobacteriaceae bacterium]|nr:HU-CCDC81 and SPOR domain-containing protein [Flavobacteriaceae bacterium]
MQFERYISDLLYRYECVIIPQFGAFLTQNVSAKVHESTNAFYPPKKVLSFNEQLQNNDGLLAHYIANVEKIPFEAAVAKIAKKTKSLKLHLAQGETLNFKNIGDLCLNKDGKLTFEPSYHLNYLTDAFGLSPYTSPPIARLSDKVSAPLEDVVQAPKETIIPIAEATQPHKSYRHYLKYAAVAVLALTLGGYGITQRYNRAIEAHNQTAEADVQAALNHKLQEATFVIENPLPAVRLNITKQSGNYHIVAGAFRLEENSDKKLKELQNLGYYAKKIGINSYGLHQVVYASYDTRSEAEQALKNIKKTHNKDAWLLIKTLN